MILDSKPKVEAIVTIMIERRIVEAECSICHDIIIAKPGVKQDEDQESVLREAIKRHAANWHRD